MTLMNTINPTISARMEQIERAVLDAIYEEQLAKGPHGEEIGRLANEPDSRDPNSPSAMRLKELLPGESIVTYALELMKASVKREKAVRDYVNARQILSDAGAL